MYRKMLSLFSLLFLFVIPLVAQSPEPPLIVYYNDDLYRLEGDALVLYEACLPDEELAGPFIPSPDGTQILMGTLPSIVSEALEYFGSLGDAPYSLNIWLCDTATDSLDRIITQPGADDPFEDEIPPIETVRGEVNWSPDGTQLIWTELSFEDDSQSVVTMDLATGERTSFTLDVPLAPFPLPPEVIAWTDEGLLLWVFEFDEDTFFNIETLVVVDVEAQSIAGAYEILNGGESDDFYSQREVVQTANGTQYALEFEQAGWVLVDLMTGELTQTSGNLALTVPGVEDSLELQYEIDFSYNYNWQETTSSAITQEFTAYPPQRIALSPAGNQIAFADSTLHIIDMGGNQVDVSNSDGFADDFAARIIWGDSTLVFVEGEEPEAPTSCEGAPPIQVTVGESARVIAETIPNRIRSEATTASEIAGEIPGSGQFFVLDGPVCAEGYTWFLIDYQGTVGWTVEGTGDNYFIETISN